jgi:glucan-binding YG repeat protein
MTISMTKKRLSRLLLAAVISITMVFGLTPLMPAGDSYAADPALTVEFRTGDTVDSTDTYTSAELAEMASDDEEITDQNYLAWDGTKFTVLNSVSGIPLTELIGGALASGWTVEVTNGTDTQIFGYQDVKNGNFYGQSTETTGIDTGASGNTAILSLATGTADVVGTAADTEVTSHDDTALRFLIGLKSKGRNDVADTYIKANGVSARYVSGVTKISLVNPVPPAEFPIYVQVGDQRELVKTFTAAELSSLAHNDILAYLQYSPWTVHATNKYIPIDELLNAAGLVFNEKDSVKPMAGDGFSTTQTYEVLQENKYFYPGTTGSATDTANPQNVGAVLALDWHDSVSITTGTAQTVLNSFDWDIVNSNGRFFMGLSEANYLSGSAAGNRLVTAPIEITLIKDVAEKGWIKSAAGWKYYGDAIAKTGWVYDAGYKGWFYLNEVDRIMETGWVKDNTGWYYLSGSGKMVVGKWLKDTNGTWYYLTGNGKMATGKLKIGSKTYTFKASGAWIG